MTNNEGKTETVVISATDGVVDKAATDAAVAPTQPAPVRGAADATEVTAPTNLKAEAEKVEYEPVVYSDPGAVTEQFDHLATRNPEAMERAPEAPDAAAATGVANMPTEQERGAIATTSANELGYQNPEASADHAAEAAQELRGAGRVEGIDTDRDVAREVGAITRGDKDL